MSNKKSNKMLVLLNDFLNEKINHSVFTKLKIDFRTRRNVNLPQKKSSYLRQSNVTKNSKLRLKTLKLQLIKK